MKKLTSLADQTHNVALDSKAIENAKQLVNKMFEALDFKSLVTKYRLGFWLFIPAVSLFAIFLGVGFFMFTENTSLPVAIALIVTSVVAMIVGLYAELALIKPARKKWQAALNANINHLEVIKSLIEGTYENVKVLGRSPSQIFGALALYKTKGIPNDARITKDYGGIDLSLNGYKVSTRKVTWHWTRMICTGNSCHTQDFYKDNFYFYATEFNQRFANFQFKMAFSSLFLNSGKELENDAFNKDFSYTHNDPIQLRVLLTPLIQEFFANETSKLDNAKSLIFCKETNYFVMVKNINKKYTPLTLDAKISKNVQVTIDSLIQDFTRDARYFLDNLAFIATFRELVKD